VARTRLPLLPSVLPESAPPLLPLLLLLLLPLLADSSGAQLATDTHTAQPHSPIALLLLEEEAAEEEASVLGRP
jgi:hypothetical protein